MRQALLCASFCATLCGSGALYAKTELLKTDPGSVVHWSRAIITVGVDPGARSATVSARAVALALDHATQAWNAVPAAQPWFEPITEGRPDVIIRFCSGRWDGETIDLGRTRFSASLRDGTVTSATVEMNECDHRFAAPDQNEKAAFDLQSVLTHELGHVLGLGHSDNRTAIMYPTGGGATVRDPHLEDQSALALIYFGRGRVQATRAPSHPSQGEAAVRAALRTGGPRTSSSTQEPADDKTGPTLPEGSVSLLTLKNAAGQDVLVYTCEPTLLPPMGAANGTDGHRAPSVRQPKRSRR